MHGKHIHLPADGKSLDGLRQLEILLINWAGEIVGKLDFIPWDNFVNWE